MTGEIEVNDRSLAFLLVVHDGNFIKYCSQQLRDNPELWRAMLEFEGGGFGYLMDWAGETVLNNTEIATLAFPRGASLQLFSNRIRADKELVRLAIQHVPTNLRWASNRLREDRAFMLDLLHQNGVVIKNVPCKMMNDSVLNLVAFLNMSASERTDVFRPWVKKPLEVGSPWAARWSYAVDMPGYVPRREGAI